MKEKGVLFVSTGIFHFQSYICNGCYFRHTDVDYRCFIYRISEREAVSLLKNVDLSEKYRTL